MNVLIPIQYGKRIYPYVIRPRLKEVAGHFDIHGLYPDMNYSLHTEYSYGPRKYSSFFVNDLKNIVEANKNGIPMLWFNEAWANEFAYFISNIASEKPPDIIEIHPPFNDYCGSISKFAQIYQVFEDKILARYPNVNILIENRFGSLYKGGRFLISKCEDLIELTNQIKKNSQQLGITLDIPQLITAYGGISEFSVTDLGLLFDELIPIKEFVKGIHIWGKKRNEKRSWIYHVGDLTTYCDGNVEMKSCLLQNLFNLFDDNIPRYFVPEVNSNDEDLHSIIQDLLNYHFSFLPP